MTAVAETTARSAEKYRVTRSRRNMAWTGLGALVIVVVLALFPYLVGAGTETVLVQAFIILTLASMWNLLAGYAGLVSVGQQAFVGLGAYFVLILNIHNISMFTALPVAAVGCGVAALPMWWLVSRLRSSRYTPSSASTTTITRAPSPVQAMFRRDRVTRYFSAERAVVSAALLSRSPPGALDAPSSLLAPSSLVTPDGAAPFGSRGVSLVPRATVQASPRPCGSLGSGSLTAGPRPGCR